MKIVAVAGSSEIKDLILYSTRISWLDAQCFFVTSGSDACDKIESARPDLVIIDADTTGTSAPDIVKQIRLFSDVAIIVIGKNRDDMDVVRCLESG